MLLQGHLKMTHFFGLKYNSTVFTVFWLLKYSGNFSILFIMLYHFIWKTLFVTVATLHVLLPHVRALMCTIVLQSSAYHVSPPHVWPIITTVTPRISGVVGSNILSHGHTEISHVYISCFPCLYAFHFNLFPHLYGITRCAGFWIWQQSEGSSTESHKAPQTQAQARTKAQRKHITFGLKARWSFRQLRQNGLDCTPGTMDQVEPRCCSHGVPWTDPSKGTDNKVTVLIPLILAIGWTQTLWSLCTINGPE